MQIKNTDDTQTKYQADPARHRHSRRLRYLTRKLRRILEADELWMLEDDLAENKRHTLASVIRRWQPDEQ